MSNPTMVPIEALLRHDDFVRGLARNLMGRDARAEDVAQDTWAAAAQGGPSSEAKARGWLGRVVRNKVASLRRRDASESRWRKQLTSPSTAPDPGELLDREAMRGHVVASLLALDPIYRDCLVLKFYEGLKPREIARRLNVPVETVRTRTRRGLDRMRADLDKRCGPRHRWLAALLPLAGRETMPVWPRWVATATAAVLLSAAVGGALWWVGDHEIDDPAHAAKATPSSGPVLQARGTKSKKAPVADVQETAPELQPWRVDGRLRWRSDNKAAHDVPVELRLVSGRKTIAVLGETRTSADGTYVFSLEALRDLSPATWSASSLFLSTPGHQNDRWPPGQEISLRGLRADAKEQVLPADIHIDRREEGKGHVMGRLLDAEGKPVADGDIGLYRGKPGAWTLVKQGCLNEVGEFDVPAGSSTYYSGGNGITEPETLTLIASAHGIGRVERSGIHVHPKVDQWIGDVTLETPPQRTRIRFELDDGKPLVGMEVLGRRGSWADLVAKEEAHRAHVHGSGTATLLTDEDGMVELAARDRTPWCLWLVRPLPEEHGDAQRPDIEVVPGSEDTRVVLRGHILRVRMTDEEGRPAAGAQWEVRGWSRSRAGNFERALEKAKSRSDTALRLFLSDRDQPDWRLRDDATRDVGPATSAMNEIVLLGEPGSKWLIVAWTSGYYRGLADVEIPDTRSRSTTDMRLGPVEPGRLRFVAQHQGEEVDAEFQWFSYVSSSSDLTMRGTLRNGHLFKKLVPGNYTVRLTCTTHQLAKELHFVDVMPGKTATLTVDVAPGGWLTLDIDAPRSLVEAHPREAYLHIKSLESGTKLRRHRFLLVPDEDGRTVRTRLSQPPNHNRHPNRLLPGRYAVQVKSEDWESAVVEVEIQVDRTSTARVTLSPVVK